MATKKGKEPAGLRRYRLARKKKAAPKKRKKAAATKKRVVKKKPAIKRKTVARKTIARKKAAPRKKVVRRKKAAVRGSQSKGIHNDWESVPRHTRRTRTRHPARSRSDAWLRKGHKIGAIHKSPHGLMAQLFGSKNPLK
jgi:hypothetical protein